MSIRRVAPRRQANGGALGCALLFVAALVGCGVLLLLIAPRLGGLAATVAGFSPSGDTERAFSSAASASIEPVINAVIPQAVTVTLPDYGARTLPVDSALTTVNVGTDSTGAPLATARVTEDGALALCRQYTPICANADPRLQNLSIDFRPGGAILYADASVPQLGGVTQRVGAVLRVNPNGRQLDFVGIDLGGQLYTAPASALGIDFRDIELLANDVLRRASVTMDGRAFTPSQIVIDDAAATLILR